jgi:hypothetical protein
MKRLPSSFSAVSTFAILALDFKMNYEKRFHFIASKNNISVFIPKTGKRGSQSFQFPLKYPKLRGLQKNDYYKVMVFIYHYAGHLF